MHKPLGYAPCPWPSRARRHGPASSGLGDVLGCSFGKPSGRCWCPEEDATDLGRAARLWGRTGQNEAAFSKDDPRPQRWPAGTRELDQVLGRAGLNQAAPPGSLVRGPHGKSSEPGFHTTPLNPTHSPGRGHGPSPRPRAVQIHRAHGERLAAGHAALVPGDRGRRELTPEREPGQRRGRARPATWGHPGVPAAVRRSFIQSDLRARKNEIPTVHDFLGLFAEDTAAHWKCFANSSRWHPSERDRALLSRKAIHHSGHTS